MAKARSSIAGISLTTHRCDSRWRADRTTYYTYYRLIRNTVALAVAQPGGAGDLSTARPGQSSDWLLSAASRPSASFRPAGTKVMTLRR